MRKFNEIDQEEIIFQLHNSKNLNEVLINLNCHGNGFNRKKLKQFIAENNIDISHFTFQLSRKKYEQNPKKCKSCGSIIPFEKRENDFCNSSCAATLTNTYRRQSGNCLNCGKEIPSRNKYCNIKCQVEHEFQQKVQKWKNGEITGIIGKSGQSLFIKKYLREKYNNSCQICGWNAVHPQTGNVPLQVHHIDGDCTNNKEENLQLLCPNCHSLTENYGSLNKNSTRIYRYKNIT